MESKDSRKQVLIDWLEKTAIFAAFRLEPLTGDASFRRYFRVFAPQQTYIAMDAPLDKENPFAFVAVAKALQQRGINTPEIVQANLQQGFLLMSDFGDDTYLRILNSQNVDALYGEALQALSVLQGCPSVPSWEVPRFTNEFIWQEWLWHKEWFLKKLLVLDLPQQEKSLDHCVNGLMQTIGAQPKVFMHRDYHSGNLMRLANNKVGVLDFQDAFIGPITYDVVSLLRDCYIDWPDEKVQQWASHYWYTLTDLHVLSAVSEAEFMRWFDWMGLERHLKALFTFARKAIRDQQMQYLNFVPRTLNYICNISSRYPELTKLHDFYQQEVVPQFQATRIKCAQ